MDKVYVGLDLGSRIFQPAALNHEGTKIMNRSFPTSEAHLRSAFARLRSVSLKYLNGCKAVARP